MLGGTFEVIARASWPPARTRARPDTNAFCDFSRARRGCCTSCAQRSRDSTRPGRRAAPPDRCVFAPVPPRSFARGAGARAARRPSDAGLSAGPRVTRGARRRLRAQSRAKDARRARRRAELRARFARGLALRGPLLQARHSLARRAPAGARRAEWVAHVSRGLATYATTRPNSPTKKRSGPRLPSAARKHIGGTQTWRCPDLYHEAVIGSPEAFPNTGVSS